MRRDADVSRAPPARRDVRVLLPARGLAATSRWACGSATRCTSRPGERAARLGVVHGLRRRARPRRSCTSSPASALRVPAGGWIEVGDRRASRRGDRPGRGRGQRAARRSWSLRFDARRSPSCATCRASGSTARRCRARSSRARRRRRASTATLRAGRDRRRSSSTAGAGWSGTTGAPSTPSAGSGCTASASRRRPRRGWTWRSAA